MNPSHKLSSTPPTVTDAMLDIGEAAYDAAPEGDGAHRRALGKAYLAMHAARSNQEATPDAELRAALEPFAKLARPKTDEPGASSPIEDIDTNYGGTGELRLSSHTEATGSHEILWASDFERAAEAIRASLAKPVQEATRTVGDAEDIAWLRDRAFCTEKGGDEEILTRIADRLAALTTKGDGR